MAQLIVEIICKADFGDITGGHDLWGIHGVLHGKRFHKHELNG